MPRFAILEHDWPTRHWDLLLEAEGTLRAWRLSEEPGPGRTVPAEANFDHRMIYLEYEGPIAGGRGTVTRWDAGTFEWIDEGIVELTGARLMGPARWTGEAWTFQTPVTHVTGSTVTHVTGSTNAYRNATGD